LPALDKSGEVERPFMPDFTDDEIRAMQLETGGRPLAEIWKSLGRTA
jgi:hypothetical protein